MQAKSIYQNSPVPLQEARIPFVLSNGALTSGNFMFYNDGTEAIRSKK